MGVVRTLRRLVVGFFWMLLVPAVAFGQATLTVWGVNAAGQAMMRDTHGQWQQTPGTLSNVSIGADGTVWGVDKAGRVLNWDGANWKPMPGQLVQVAVGSALNVWGVSANDNIWNWDGRKWNQIQGKLTHVSVGCDRSVWGVNRAGQVWSWDGVKWTQMPGGLRKVAVGRRDNIWGVNANDDIWRWDGSKWTQVPGKLSDISVSCAGAVLGVNRAGQVLSRDGSTWRQMSGSLVQVAHDSMFIVNLGSNYIEKPVSNQIDVPSSQISFPVGQPSSTTGQTTGQTTGPTTASTTDPAPARSDLGGGRIDGPFVIGPVGKSMTSCGVQGTQLCGYKPAEFVHNSSSNCPAGSFMDIGRMSCWSCPKGFVRGGAAVDTERACTKADATAAQDFKPATFQSYLCPEGTFHDPLRGGECWKCPPGFNRSAASVEAPNACHVPMGENFSAATRTRVTPWPSDCANGSFFDIYNGGACYTCPAGHHRTAYHINDGKACSIFVAEQQAKAEVVQKAQCAVGEFFDMKIPGQQNTARGGACYTCPRTYDRTVYSVDDARACEIPAGVSYAVATRAQPLACEGDEIFDPISSANPDMEVSLNARNAAAPDNQVTKAAIGGTCWKCPSGARRSMFPIFGPSACDMASGIRWQSARYNQPGLFGLQGGEAVALAMVKEKATIDAILADMKAGPLGDKLPPDYVDKAWEEISKTPQNSPALKMAVFARVVAASTTPARATPDEIKLRDDVIRNIRDFKVFMSQDALDAYRAWKGSEDWRKGMQKQSVLQQSVDIGQVPPDFEDITARTILGSLATSAAMDTAIYLGFTQTSLFQRLMPFAQRARFTAVRFAQGTKSAARTLGKAVSETGIEFAKGATSGVTASVGSIGPQIIIAIGIEVLAAAIEQQIDIANAEPKLLTSLANARNAPLDFARLMTTQEGTSEVMGYWSQLMAGPSVPSPLADLMASAGRVSRTAPVDGSAFKVAVAR